ncbi:hypothetical protein [Azospirillum sp. A39]|uniref:hypothetical protein n=1 Tax=Azospirillum sp. A39 TaxID=3462279 RepID=UPI0040462F3F
MRRTKLPLALLATTLLAGCATAPSDPSVCPVVVEYGRETMARAADELDALPANSALRRMLDDYKVERARLRECR